MVFTSSPSLSAARHSAPLVVRRFNIPLCGDYTADYQASLMATDLTSHDCRQAFRDYAWLAMAREMTVQLSPEQYHRRASAV